MNEAAAIARVQPLFVFRLFGELQDVASEVAEGTLNVQLQRGDAVNARLVGRGEAVKK